MVHNLGAAPIEVNELIVFDIGQFLDLVRERDVIAVLFVVVETNSSRTGESVSVILESPGGLVVPGLEPEPEQCSPKTSPILR